MQKYYFFLCNSILFVRIIANFIHHLSTPGIQRLRGTRARYGILYQLNGRIGLDFHLGMAVMNRSILGSQCRTYATVTFVELTQDATHLCFLHPLEMDLHFSRALGNLTIPFATHQTTDEELLCQRVTINIDYCIRLTSSQLSG